MRRSLLLLLFAVILVGLDLFTIEHVHTCTDEHRPSLYGFPMVHRTGVPWVNSMSGVRYVAGTLVNVICMWCVLLWIAWMLRCWPWWRDRSFPQWLPWLALMPGLAMLILDLLAVEWNWQWGRDWDMACFTGHWRIGHLFR